jgi:tetratricopeptide (TPR) repeat protein
LAIDRAEALKKAEKLLRQGKLDLAIAEYVKMIDEQPRDWNTRNMLGDLYVRANQPDKAIAQYTQIADHLYTEGFLPKASALYKKILKIKPDEESVLMHLGEISATQGLLADAKAHFLVVASKRRARGDRAGADEILVRLGSLDPGDFEARALAARTLVLNGDAIAAAALYRAMHADLLDKGRADEAAAALREAVTLNPADVEGRVELARAAIAANDLEAAKPYLDRTMAAEDPALLMALMEIEIRGGQMDNARDILSQLLHIDVSLRSRIVELAWALAPTSPDGAFVCIDTAVDAELAAGNYVDAAAILQEFVTRVSGQIAALLKLVEICVDGGLEATMYETQAHLADAYLERGQAAEARVIAEDLVAREPWEHAHIDRFRRSLVMLNVPDPDALIADRLSGQGPFVATDPFMAPESFGEPPPDGLDAQPPLVPEQAAAVPPELEEDARVEVEPDIPLRPRAPEPDIPLRPRAVEPDIPLKPRKPDAGTGKGQKKSDMDIDLTDVLSELQGMSSVAKPKVPPAAAKPSAPPPPSAQNLDAVFSGMRSEAASESDSEEAGEHLGLAKTYLEMGMTDEAAASLETAARSPRHRFEAAALLGRLYLKQDDVPHAVEWLERAAEAPAASADEAHELLYELGTILESSGETARALAVFIELQADAGDYRDVAARVEHLARVQTGG